MPTSVLAALLFCSGAAALVWETLWVKQVGLLVGIDVHAVTTVVSAFFAGLAIGSALLGRAADRTRQPLALYAGLEAGTALLAVIATFSLAHLAPVYVRAAQAGGRAAWALPFVLVAAPALLMGGTLPAVLRAAAPAAEGVGAASGVLYAANTAGGVLGALATPGVLIGTLGVRGTGLAAAGVSAATAAAAALLARPVHAGCRGSAAIGPLPHARLALALYAIAGGIALGYEVVWTQAVVQFLNTRAYAFALVLAVYLIGLVAGSALWARIADRVRRPWIAFGLLELGAGAAALGTFAALGPWLPQAQHAVATWVAGHTGSVGAGIAAHMATAPVVLLLGPTLLLGAAFPAAARLVCEPGELGRDLGAVVGVNTAGGIAGTVLAGFVCIPAVGVSGTLSGLAIAAALVGGAALVRGAVRPARAATVAGIAVVAVTAAAMAVPRDHLARVLVAMHGGSLVSYEESAGGTVAVLEEPFMAGRFRRLYIQGVSNSHDGLMSRRYMRLQALLPLLVHEGESRRALVVGLGTGITCGALLPWPGLDERACAELLPAVVRASRRFAGNYAVADDPRATIRLADGRQLLLLEPAAYDVITLEPPPPVAASVVNLYSREFYALCRDRLAPHGLMAQWLPLATQNDEDSRALVRSFLDVFPHASVWTTEMHEMLLTGSMEPVPLDAARIAARFADPGVTAALAEVGLPDAAAVLATYVAGRPGLEAYAGDAAPVTDDRPRIEHAGWLRLGEFPRALAHLLQSREDPPLVHADPELAARVAASRRRLLTFYQAAVYWYAGQREEMEPLLRQVLEEEPANPYYRWFIGRRDPGAGP